MITAGATAIYRKDWDGFSVAPYVQVLHEQQLKDADHHVLQQRSAGRVLYTGGSTSGGRPHHGKAKTFRPPFVCSVELWSSFNSFLETHVITTT
jgi:hypothetical protein